MDQIIKPPTARFGINEIVYIKESASLGYIESLKVYSIRHERNINKNLYGFAFGKSSPRTQIAGDAIDLKNAKFMELLEDDLCSFKEALELKITALENELDKTRTRYNSIL